MVSALMIAVCMNARCAGAPRSYHRGHTHMYIHPTAQTTPKKRSGGGRGTRDADVEKRIRGAGRVSPTPENGFSLRYLLKLATLARRLLNYRLPSQPHSGPNQMPSPRRATTLQIRSTRHVQGLIRSAASTCSGWGHPRGRDLQTFSAIGPARERRCDIGAPPDPRHGGSQDGGG